MRSHSFCYKEGRWQKARFKYKHFFCKDSTALRYCEIHWTQISEKTSNFLYHLCIFLHNPWSNNTISENLDFFRIFRSILVFFPIISKTMSVKKYCSCFASFNFPFNSNYRFRLKRNGHYYLPGYCIFQTKKKNFSRY